MSLRHLCDQVQARYPQAIIRQLAKAHDPLALREGEIVSAVELCAGAAVYLPLRALRERELLQEGADPLLGILGVFNHLPAHMRVVTQLALLPAPPAWSQPYRRKSVEHPLEQEHLRARRELSGAQGRGPRTFKLAGLGILVTLLFVFSSQAASVSTHDASLSGRLWQHLVRHPFPWSSLMDVYRDWRETASQHQRCRQEQEEVLDHLVAAYRQYHTASGGYFVPQCVPQRKARCLLVKRKGWLRSRISGWEDDLARSSHLLSIADIAALWHLPQAQDLADLPYVERARARTAMA